jgi:predicted transcriptional regulator YdeE
MNFDELMETPVEGITPGTGANPSASPAQDTYTALVKHGNLRTYSTTETFHACPRKYAIYKMQAAHGTEGRSNTTTFAYGHAVGAGVAAFDATEDMDKAIWAAFLAWDMDLFADERKLGRKNGKSFHEAVWALYTYRTFREEETDLADYESVGVEQTIAVDFGDGHFFSGHIDQLLRNKYTGKYRVKENKTTGLSSIDPCMYSNSDQALGYSIVIDSLGATDYEVMYTIYSATAQKWVQFSFIKTVHKKAEWLQDQLLVNQQIDTYSELRFFPKRGSSCFSYMRRCEYYETCDMSFAAAYGQEFSDLQKIDSLDSISAIEPVDYPTSLSQLVAKQKENLS